MRWVWRTTAIVAMLGMGAPGSWSYAGAQDIAAPLSSPALAELVAKDRADSGLTVPAETPIGAEQLDKLVAPVALYPDALLAQVLVAATYPLQIAEADQLLEKSDGMSDNALDHAIADQDWDPSVTVLTSGFPTVVQRMADDLDWTERLGGAMVAQDADVLEAVQRKRQEAVSTGYLASNEAQVVDRDPQRIAIRAANPDVVYVPRYDPDVAFTSAPTAAPYIAPRQNLLANPLVAGAIAFGSAFLVSELFGNDDHHGNDDDHGWNDYWHRSNPFDWQARQFYPRPDGSGHHDRGRSAWSHERDQFWDRSSSHWRFDDAARRQQAAERRAALAHVEHDRAARASHFRELRKAVVEEKHQDDRDKAAAIDRRKTAAEALKRQQHEDEAADRARRDKARAAKEDRDQQKAHTEAAKKQQRKAREDAAQAHSDGPNNHAADAKDKQQQDDRGDKAGSRNAKKKTGDEAKARQRHAKADTHDRQDKDRAHEKASAAGDRTKPEHADRNKARAAAETARATHDSGDKAKPAQSETKAARRQQDQPRKDSSHAKKRDCRDEHDKNCQRD